MSVTGLFLIDGGKLFDEEGQSGPNRFTWYRTQSLPNFGLTLQGLESRLSASGFNYYANMVRSEITGYVFEDRPATYFSKGTLTSVTGDLTPVLVINFLSGHFENVDDYKLQFRAENVADSTRVEYFPIINVRIIQEV